MPEGDTVWRTARRLHAALTGVPLVTLEVRWGDHGGSDLLPATTVDVVSRGKHVLHHLDNGVTLHTHLRMEGRWQVAGTARVTANDLANPQVRVLAQTATWTALGLRLGQVDIWPTSADQERLGHLGPDLLGPDWDLDRALANVARQADQPIAAALLDQRNLAGIGTFWAAEGLFQGRISPWTPVADVPATQITDIVTAIRRLMRQSSLSAVQSSTGRNRRGETAYVHARSGRPCLVCGEDVRVARLGTAANDRVIFYCARCQGGLAPTDDGARQEPLGSARPRTGNEDSRRSLRPQTPRLRRREV